jgi:hypothetical protein
MSNTKRETMLGHQDGYTCSSFFGKECDCDACIYEAARAKDAELIQQLVDGLHKVATLADVDTDDRSTIARDPLYAAEAAGFKPSER